MFCQACGAKLLEGARFCGACGTPVAKAETEQPTTIRPPAEAPARPLVPPPAAQPLDAAGQPQTPSRPAAPAQPQTPVQPQAPAQPIPPVGPASRPGYGAGGYSPAGGYGPAPGAGPAGGYGAPGPGQYGAPRPPHRAPRRENSRLPLWIGLAATAVIIIGAAVAVWLLLANDDDTVSTSTTKVAQSTTTTAAQTTTSSPTSTTASTAPSTTVTLPLGAPGDSPGQWAELNIPGLPAGAYAVAVSDQALLIDADQGDGYALYAYVFETEKLVELPVKGPDFGGEDLDGLMAVWWEGDYDEGTDTYSDEYIYAYALPDGPKVKIAGGDRSVYYPQVAGQWITWAEEERWQENPDEYYFSRIFGLTIDPSGNPRGDPIELVPAATSYSQGDTSWTYSLSATHIAWENAVAVDVFDPGVYTLDLTSLQPQIVETEVWRPSTSAGKVVYSDGGLITADLSGGAAPVSLDPQGDFASAAPTYAAYFRSAERDGTSFYEIVARGYTGSYEQTLGSQEDPPWFSPLISASANHVAFIVAGTVHVFEWRGP